MNFFLFLYLCAISAHKTGEGFDAIFLRVTFVLYVGAVALSFLMEKKRIVVNNYILWLFAFCGFYYLSFIWARNQNSMMALSNTMIQIFGVSLGLIQQLKDKKDISNFLKLIHLSIVYTATYLVIRTPFEVFGTDRIGDITGLHANAIGARLATGVLLGLYFFTEVKKYRWFYMITTIVFSVLVLLTGSRKSISMILICVFVYVVFYKSKQQNAENLIKKMLLVFSMIVLLIMLWYLMMNVEFFYNVIGIRFEAMLNTFLGTDTDGSMNERAFYAEKAYELFKQHPIIGYGGNNFSQYMREIGYSHISYSHNNFAELLSTLGIIGTSIFYVPLIFFTYGLIKSYFLDSKGLLGLLLIIYMAFTFLTTSYSMYYNSEFYYMFFLCTYMYYKLTLRKGNKR